MDNYDIELNNLNTINKNINENDIEYKMYKANKKDSILCKKVFLSFLMVCSLFLDVLFGVSSIMNPSINSGIMLVLNSSFIGFGISGLLVASILHDQKRLNAKSAEYLKINNDLQFQKKEIIEKLKTINMQSISNKENDYSYSEKEVLENIKKEIEFLLTNNSNNVDDKIKKL